MNKTAKEMFEEINGDYFENEERITIEFYNGYTDDYDYVEFDKICNTLSINIDQSRIYKKMKNFDFENVFKAINKQIEELGWSNE